MTPLAWNTLGAGNLRRVHGKWIGYRYGDEWRTIDPTFVNSGSRFAADKLPFHFDIPALATQTASFIGDNEWDIFANSRITDTAIQLDITPEDVSPVSGTINPNDASEVVYSGAYKVGGVPIGDLVYRIYHGRAPRGQKIVQLNSATGLAGPLVEFPFLISHNDGRAFFGGQRWNGANRTVNTAVEIRKGDSLRRGAGMKPPMAWYIDADGNTVRVPIDQRWERVNGTTMRMVKIVPLSLVTTALTARPGGWLRFDATVTIYPDADVETTSCDGYAQRSINNSSWTALSGGAGTSAFASNLNDVIIFARGDASPLWKQVTRAFFGFDTSSVTGTIDSASLNLYTESTSFTDPDALNLNAYGASPASATTVAASDFETAGTTKLATGLEFVNFGGDAYTGLTLNASGIAAIDTGGVTQFAVCSEADRDDVAPTHPGDNVQWGVKIQMAEAANDPHLEIVTSSGGSGMGPCHTSINCNQYFLWGVL